VELLSLTQEIPEATLAAGKSRRAELYETLVRVGTVTIFL
jgi:hypothetical protein